MIHFDRGEIVADKCGRTFVVKSQTGPRVWASPTDGCACSLHAAPFNARDLSSVSPADAEITERDWMLAARGNPGVSAKIERVLGREEVVNG